MSDSRITDEVVELAAQAYNDAIETDAFGDVGDDQHCDAMQAALEAALPHLAPQPVVDRAALVEALKAWKASDGAWWIPPGAVAEVADRLTDEIRTAVVAGLTEHRSPAGGWIPQIYVEQITDAVLALLNGTAK